MSFIWQRCFRDRRAAGSDPRRCAGTPGIYKGAEERRPDAPHVSFLCGLAPLRASLQELRSRFSKARQAFPNAQIVANPSRCSAQHKDESSHDKRGALKIHINPDDPLNRDTSSYRTNRIAGNMQQDIWFQL